MTNKLQLILVSLVVTGVSFLPVSVLAAPSEKTTVAEADTAKKKPAESKAKAKEESDDEDEGDEESTDEGDAAEEHAASKAPQDVSGFTIQHRINGKSLEPEKTKADPMVLFQTFKNSIAAQIDKQPKPLQIESDVNIILSEEISKELGKIPSLSVKTNVDEAGKGKSEFNLPAYKHEVNNKDKKSNGVLEWKGLTGQLNFAEKFKSLSLDAVIAGLSIKDEKGFSALLDKTTFSGELDADLMPTKIDFSLPMLKFTDEGDKSNGDLQKVTLNMKVDKASNGVDLTSGSFKIGQLNYAEKGVSKAALDSFEVSVGTEAKGDFVNYAFRSKIAKFSVPSENLEFNYNGNLEFRHLDAATLVELQKTVRDLQKQRQTGSISEEMVGIAVIGKLMEVSPKLLAKSPEIALTELLVKTKEGELQGKASISVDGKKPISLQDPSVLMAATQAQAEFTINRGFLEKIATTQALQGSRKAQKLSEDEMKKLEKDAKAMVDKQIQEFVKNNYLVDAGNNTYKTVLQFQGGKLTVNGKEVPLGGGSQAPGDKPTTNKEIKETPKASGDKPAKDEKKPEGKK